jgi:AraC-like DNA-binding protein
VKLLRQAVTLNADSLKLHFQHVKRYELDYTWRISGRLLYTSVLWWVEQGTCRVEVNGTYYEGSKGDLLYLPTDSVISCHAVSDKITITSINFEAEISHLPRRLWSDILHFPIQFPYEMTNLLPILNNLADISLVSSIGQVLLLQAEFQKLIAMLLNQLYESSSEHTYEGIGDTRVQSIIEYIASHAELMPEVRELAELIQISKSHLRKLFIDHTGLSPLQFIHQWKINQAKEWLEERSDHISEIGYRLGYRDANYFARMFKKYSGLTPQAYRERYRNWMNN